MTTATQPRHRSPLLATLAVFVTLTLAACDTDGTTETADPAVVPPTTDVVTPAAPAVPTADLDALQGRVELAEQHVESATAMIADLRAQVDGDAETLATEAEQELVEAQAVLDDMLVSLDPTAPADPVSPDPAADPEEPATPAN